MCIDYISIGTKSFKKFNEFPVCYQIIYGYIFYVCEDTYFI